MKAAAATAALALVASTAHAAKWCTISADEQTKCTQMATIINGNKPSETWSCVQEADAEACTAAIQAGGAAGADLRSIGASDVFKASEAFGAQLVAGERLGTGADAAPAEYFALAIVRKDQDMSKGWESLRGKKSCHTGYGKTSGWTMPVGTLLTEGVFTPMNADDAVPNDTEIVRSFFSESCAPGRTDPVEDGVTAICGGCDGDCSWNTETEAFYDYPGSFACLKAGGDVAFTKQGIVPASEQADYLLVCRDGTTQPLSAYKTCNLATVPSHSVITRGDVTPTQLAAWQKDLLAASALASFKALFFNADANPDGLVFASDANALVAVPSSAITHIGDAYEAFRSLASAQAMPLAGGAAAPGAADTVKTAVWCVEEPAKAKCESMVTVLNTVGTHDWSCLVLDSTEACIEAMEKVEGQPGTPDVISVGASAAVAAAQQFGSQLVVSENYGSEGVSFPTEYYALAIVAADRDVSGGWESLRGLSSCHTGYRKTSGWTMPVGTLLEQGTISYAGNTNPEVPNDIYAMKQFFKTSCAPSNADVVRDGINGICSACGGDCTWTEREPYQDYPGAFACLKAGAGQIAFTRQGEVPAAEEANYKLLCPDGRTQPLANFESCNLARVPAHAVLTGGKRSASRIVALASDLLTASANADFQALFFEEDANPDGLVLSSDATGLLPVETSSVVAEAGDAFFAYKAISDSDTTVRTGAAKKDSGKSAEAAAIALGIVLALVVLATAVLVFRMRKSNRRLSKELAKAQGTTQEWGASHATMA